MSEGAEAVVERKRGEMVFESIVSTIFPEMVVAVVTAPLILPVHKLLITVTVGVRVFCYCYVCVVDCG